MKVYMRMTLRMLSVALLGKTKEDGSKWRIMPNVLQAKVRYP